MRLALIPVVAGLLAVLLALILAPTLLQASNRSPAALADGYQLLVNPGMEVFDPPYADDCQVASGWQRFWTNSQEPCWMDTAVYAGDGWVERIEGDTSQLIVGTEPYTAGIRQQVTGLTPGVDYGFHAAMLTIYQTSASDGVDGTMIKQVGMDPTGGTDPEAPTVIWSEADDHDQGPWSIDLRTAATAQSSTVTVFIRVVSLYDSGGGAYENLSFLDSAILARTPVVYATSPALSESPTFVVCWDNAEAAPGGGYVRWYDVQWLDEAEGVWHDWQVRTSAVEATFCGEAGHTYRFRARAWQRYLNNAHLWGPYRPEGDTTTHVAGGQQSQLVGKVSSPAGQPIAGATVAISGTTFAASSGSFGEYALSFPTLPGPLAVTVYHPLWLAPAPVYGLMVGPTETVTLDWTLRPPDDALLEGGFESSLKGWTVIAADGVTPALVTAPVHSGHGALRLGGTGVPGQTAGMSFTVGVSQTVILTGARDPVLSFWYRPVTTDSGDRFNAILTVVSATNPAALLSSQRVLVTAPVTGAITGTQTVVARQVLTPSLQAGDWAHVWASLGRPRASFDGRVTVQFEVWNDGDDGATVVYLDDASLGSTPVGPFRVYNPIVLRH
jgi:hypothetical protein